ncbi:MAG: hypothetical protein KGY70_19090 [Bacteroidales bacterium]|nr:hypothetical protein [Bacteroidales bacterium]
MTNEERKELKEEIKGELHHLNNGITKKILIIVIPLIIVAGLSSYMRVMTAEKVNRERIKNNSHKTESLSNSIENVRDENNRQWKYIIDFANRRGDKIDSE